MSGREQLLPSPASQPIAEEGPEHREGSSSFPGSSLPSDGAVPFKALFRFATRCDRLLTVAGILGALAQGMTVPLMAVYMQSLFNSIFIPNDDGTLPPEGGPHSLRDKHIRSTCLVFLLLGALAFFSAGMQSLGLERAAEHQTRALRVACFDKLLRKDIGWYDRHTAGEVATLISRSSTSYKDGLVEPLGSLVRSGCSAVLGFGVAFWMDWRMALAMCAAVPFMAGSVLFSINVQTRFSSKVQVQIAQAGGVAEAALSTIRTVAAYGGYSREIRRFDDRLVVAEHIGNRMGLAQGFGTGFVYMIIYASIAVGFYVGSLLVTSGYERGCWRHEPQPFGDCFTGATMMAVLQAVITGGVSLASVGPCAAGLGAARSAAALLYAILDEPVEIDPEAGGAKLAAPEGDIDFCQVRFAYPARPTAKILNGLTLRIPAGRSMAFVGMSGSGKSTIIQLVERFYDPVAGRVTFDGHDLRTLDLSWLRSRMALVQQEPVLFSGSIAENIEQGACGATREQVLAAAKAANAHGFVSSFPAGYDTVLGDRGTQLSGGQKQRIAIARGMIRDPVVLMLDEATSALDNESERVVQDAIDELLKAKRMTTLIVAHRLTTVQKADQICVLGPGFVADLGTHEELIKRPGLYADLVALQSVAGVEKSTRDLMRTITGERSPARQPGRARSVPASSRFGMAFRESGSQASGDGRPHRRSSSVRGRGRSLYATADGGDTEPPSWTGASAMRRRESNPVAFGLPDPSSWLRLRQHRRHRREDSSDDSEEETPPPSPGARGGRAGSVAAGAAQAGGGGGATAAGPPVAAPPAEDPSLFDDMAAGSSLSVRYLWSLNRKDCSWISLGLLATVVSSAALPVLGVIYASAANALNAPPAIVNPSTGEWSPIFDTEKIRDASRKHFFEFLTLGLIMLPASVFQSWGFRKASESLTRQLQKMTFKAMLRQDIAWFDVRSTGALVERLASDVPMMKCFTFEAAQILLQTGLSIFGGLALALLASWRLAICSVAFIPVVMLAHILTIRSRTRQHESKTGVVVAEAVDNIRTVAAFGLQDVVGQRFSAALVEEFRLDRRISNAVAFAQAYGSAISFVFYASLVFLSSVFMNAGLMGPEGVIGVFSPVMFSAGGIGQAQLWSSQKAKAKGASARIATILRRQPRIDVFDEGRLRPDRVEGRVEFRHVTFRYPARPDLLVFNDLELVIQPGTTNAFVGPSGCGKSTVVALLQRFYDPLGGTVLLDGRDLREFNLAWLREQMALVQQEPVLFGCSIFDNIAYGRAGSTMDDVVAAARTANADDFITQFPEGYDTDVGARGSQLSGGQKQRIAIARGMIRDPALLLLDEATSALDLDSERVVQEALDALLKERPFLTTIVIAHRLSTIHGSDRIFVLSEGRICEAGTHTELVLAGGVYASLVARQQQRKVGH